MNKNIFAHAPYTHLASNLDFLVGRRQNPEIFFSAEALEALMPEEVAAAAATLFANGMETTIHAPFIDLNPGSAERMVREATLHRFSQVLDAAEILKPRIIVFHPGYDKWRYGESRDKWLGHSIESWQRVLERSERIGCIVAVENIFEEEPSTLKALFEGVASPRFRHCFDVGHWNLFKQAGMEAWFEQVGEYIAETHVHDNFGLRDDHAPIGEGNIDFALFFRLMESYAPHAAYTVEAHSMEKMERALARLAQFL